jgi:hypothetical protein
MHETDTHHAHPASRLIAAAAFAAVALYGVDAAAQTNLDDSEIIDRTGRDAGSAKPSEKPSNDEDSQRGGSGAEDGIERFEDVKMKRIRPKELPPAESTEMPKVLRQATLPTPPSARQLEETATKVASHVVELVAIQQPKTPGRSTPVVHKGHAVWVQTPGDDSMPVLITSYFWLAQAEKLFIVPGDAEVGQADGEPTRRASGGAPRAGQRGLDEMTVDRRRNRWLEDPPDGVVEAKLFQPDEHRNLVTVVPQTTDGLGLPERGLDLFDLEGSSPTRLYGYNRISGGLVQTQIGGNVSGQKALVYYLQTAFRPVFGAPIVSTDGELVVLTAFRHPKDRQTTLVIPPIPIRNYLTSVREVAR